MKELFLKFESVASWHAYCRLILGNYIQYLCNFLGGRMTTVLIAASCKEGQRFPNCGPRTPGACEALTGGPLENGEIIVFLQNLERKMCKFLYTVTSKKSPLKNHYSSYLSPPAVKQIIA